MRDVVKGVAYFASMWKTQGKLFKGLHKSYDFVENKTISFAEKALTDVPKEYGITTEGIILEAN